MRVIFRLLAIAALVAATIAGVIDSVQSVASSRVVLTPLRNVLADLWPGALDWLDDVVADHLAPLALEAGASWLLGQPAFAVLLGLAFLFHAAGYSRRRPRGRLLGR